jgi:hypothetical protein
VKESQPIQEQTLSVYGNFSLSGNQTNLMLTRQTGFFQAN